MDSFKNIRFIYQVIKIQCKLWPTIARNCKSIQCGPSMTLSAVHIYIRMYVHIYSNDVFSKYMSLDMDILIYVPTLNVIDGPLCL